MRILFLLLTISINAFSQLAVEQNNAAVELMEQNEFEKAVRILDPIIKADPASTLYRYNRAVCLSNLERYTESLADYRILCKAVPDEPEYFFQVGNILEKLNRLDSVEFYYTVSLQLDRKNYLHYFKRGTYYLKEKEWAKAITDFSEAIKLNPDYYNSWHNRAIAKFKSGNKEAACSDWCEAVALGSPLSSIHIDKNCKGDLAKCDHEKD